MSPWATKETTCTECEQRIEWWPGDYGMPGWYDPDRHDLDTPGNACPETFSEHEPAEVSA